jgi:hypothetical protein
MAQYGQNPLRRQFASPNYQGKQSPSAGTGRSTRPQSVAQRSAWDSATPKSRVKPSVESTGLNLNMSKIARDTTRLLDTLTALLTGEDCPVGKAKSGVKTLNKMTRRSVADKMASGRTKSDRKALSSITAPKSKAATEPKETNRLRDGSGAMTVHFAVSCVSNGHGGSPGAGAAVKHQQYVERDGAPEKILTLNAAGETASEGYEAYLARANSVDRDDAVAIIAAGFSDQRDRPQEAKSGFAFVGNVGATSAERDAFWSAVEETEPVAKRGDILMSRTDLNAAAILTALAEDRIKYDRELEIIEGDNNFARISIPDAKTGQALAKRINFLSSAASEKIIKPATYKPGRSGRVQVRIIVELPHELTAAQRYEALTDYCRKTFEDKGLRYFAVIHKPDAGGDQRNFHAHIVFYDRPAKRVWEMLGKTEPENRDDLAWDFSLKALDKNKRVLHPYAQSKSRDMQGGAWIKSARSDWVDTLNTALESAGCTKRHFAQSYADLGIAAVPTIHLGPAASAMERRGETSAQGDALLAREEKQPRRSRRFLDEWNDITNDLFELGVDPKDVFDVVDGKWHNRRPIPNEIEIAALYVQDAGWVSNYLELRRDEQRRMAAETGRIEYRRRALEKKASISWESAKKNASAKGKKTYAGDDAKAKERRDRAFAQEAASLDAMEKQLLANHEKVWASLEAANVERLRRQTSAGNLRKMLLGDAAPRRGAKVNKGAYLAARDYGIKIPYVVKQEMADAMNPGIRPKNISYARVNDPRDKEFRTAWTSKRMRELATDPARIRRHDELVAAGHVVPLEQIDMAHRLLKSGKPIMLPARDINAQLELDRISTKGDKRAFEALQIDRLARLDYQDWALPAPERKITAQWNEQMIRASLGKKIPEKKIAAARKAVIDQGAIAREDADFAMASHHRRTMAEDALDKQTRFVDSEILPKMIADLTKEKIQAEAQAAIYAGAARVRASFAARDAASLAAKQATANAAQPSGDEPRIDAWLAEKTRNQEALARKVFTDPALTRAPTEPARVRTPAMQSSTPAVVMQPSVAALSATVAAISKTVQAPSPIDRYRRVKPTTPPTDAPPKLKM